MWRVGRNLSAWDRTQLALKLKPMIAAKAKEKEHERKEGTLPNLAESIDTRKELASIAGVSRLTRNQMGDSHENGRKPVLRRGRRVARGWIG